MSTGRQVTEAEELVDRAFREMRTIDYFTTNTINHPDNKGYSIGVVEESTRTLNSLLAQAIVALKK